MHAGEPHERLLRGRSAHGDLQLRQRTFSLLGMLGFRAMLLAAPAQLRGTTCESAFYTSGGDAFDEVFLGKEEKQEDGGDDYDGGGHELVPFGAAVLGLEVLEA